MVTFVRCPNLGKAKLNNLIRKKYKNEINSYTIAEIETDDDDAK